MTLTTASIGQQQVNRNTTQQTAATGASNQDRSATAEESGSSGATQLSDRAQKIQKLNEEFFSGGPRSVKITPAFIQRLEEYGFLNKSEATNLLNTHQGLAESADDTVGDLTEFISDFSRKLEQESPESSFLTTLEKAQTVLDHIGNTDSNTRLDIKTTVAELNQFMNSDSAESLTAKEKDQFTQLQMVLSVADKLQPENLSRSKLNEYVRIHNGF